MEHKTNYWALLLLAIILWGVTYFIKKESSVGIEMPIVGIVHNNIFTAQNLEKITIGSLELKYPKQFTYKVYDNTLYDFNTHKQFVTINSSNNIQISDYYPIKISYLPNGNPKKLSLDDWWQEEDPNNYPHLTGPDVVKKIKINDIATYQVVYTHVTGEYDDTYWYSDVSVFIVRNTEVYEMKGYILAKENPDSRFTPADIQSAQEYEKIFNDILASFKFVD